MDKLVFIGARIPIELKVAFEQKNINISKVVRNCLLKYANEQNIKLKGGFENEGAYKN